jgi:hypothetical protein
LPDAILAIAGLHDDDRAFGVPKRGDDMKVGTGEYLGF